MGICKCKYCSAEFNDNVLNKKYCSTKCRKAYHRTSRDLDMKDSLIGLSLLMEYSKAKPFNKMIQSRNVRGIISKRCNIPFINVGISELKRMGLYRVVGRGVNRKTYATKSIIDIYNNWSHEDALLPSTTRREFIFGEELVANLFNGYKVLPQYKVLNKYKIDWYVPELNIAIEFDEEGHLPVVNCDYDNKRQKEIETELHCKFIRYKDYVRD